jgi:hypothetical protein
MPPEFPIWVSQNSPQPQESGSVFEQYVRAADQAESAGHKYLQMVSFYPGQRMGAMKASESAVGIVDSASSGKCDFDFLPTSPFQAPKNQQGWRLIGRDLVWKIQDNLKLAKYDEAVSATVTATKFGFDISGGGATDASLGFAIADEARKAMAPALNRLSPGQLAGLAAGIERALDAKPSLSQVVDHEHENMLECVQVVQDDYRDRRFDDLSVNLGPDSRGAVEYLKELSHKDTTQRPAYFIGFAAEADTLANWMKSVAELPGVDRQTKPEPKFSSERPWKKLSKEFFSSLKPLLQMSDQTVARTRLLILESLILQQVKANGVAPSNLSAFADSLKTDPYSGKPFVYGADGTDYHVYSVGADFRDDGGETDETYTQPDLKLERDE